MKKSVTPSNFNQKNLKENFNSNRVQRNLLKFYILEKSSKILLKITKRALYTLAVLFYLIATESANLVKFACRKLRSFYFLVATPDEETLDHFSRHLWRVEIQRLSDLFEQRTSTINELRLRSSGRYRLSEDRISKFKSFESSENEAEMQCVVCLNEFGIGRSLIQLDCEHCFCAPCIRKWFEKDNSCPVCRRKFYNVDLK